jgi:hypothetical protein
MVHLMVPSRNWGQELWLVTNRYVGSVGARPYAYTWAYCFNEYLSQSQTLFPSGDSISISHLSSCCSLLEG